MRRIFDLCVDEGLGIEAIMHQLNDEGVPSITRESKRWNSQTIWSILRGKEALGFCCYVEPPVKPFVSGDSVILVPTDSAFLQASTGENKYEEARSKIAAVVARYDA